MRAVVVYESMYGNTHLVAAAIGRGIEEASEAAVVAVVPVEEANQALLGGVDLIVVGGPTHAHGMSRPATRESAVADARRPDSELTLDPDAEGEGLREWFDELPAMAGAAAAFDTRIDLAAALTGRASKGISKRLRKHGFEEVVEPESFFVRKDNTLADGEVARATAWGVTLAGITEERTASS